MDLIEEPVPVLRFDPVEHRYYLGDRELPSVSRILQLAGEAPSYGPGTSVYAQNGIRIHKAIELFERGVGYVTDAALKSWTESLDPDIQPRLEAWIKFRTDYALTVLVSERRVWSKLGYAGTIDHVGTSPAVPGHVVVELKTGRPEPFHALQTAAYMHAYAECTDPDATVTPGCRRPLFNERLTVYVKRDGTYQVKQYDSIKSDWERFLIALEKAKTMALTEEVNG